MNPLILAKLFVIALFIPGEFTVHLGGLRLEIYRVVLGIAFLNCLFLLFTARPKLEVTDKLVIGLTAWASITLMINHGFAGGLEKAGIFAFEFFGAYFLARMAITSERKFIAVFKYLCWLVVIFLIPAAIEVFTGRKYVHEISEMITGIQFISQKLYTEDYMRAGLTRAASTFSHPILNGAMSAITIPIAFYLYVRKKSYAYLLALIACLFSVATALSSAPLLIIVVQLGVVGYVVLKRMIKSKIKYVVGAISFAALVLHITSNRGIIKLIIQTMTFNPHTGTHRLLIIEHLSDDIMRRPIFGSGIGAYWSAPGWMGQSIDNFWMAISFFYGIPYAVGVAIIGFWCLFKINVSKYPKKQDLLAYTNKAMILSLMIIGVTVHLFGKLNPLLFFAMGSSIFLFNYNADSATVPKRTKKRACYVE